MSLDEMRKKVIFHNSVDIWITFCNEKNVVWSDTEKYKKFIAYLLQNNKINLKVFNLCAHEAGATEDQKTKFTEALSDIKNDPNSLTYTIKLTNDTINVIREHLI